MLALRRSVFFSELPHELPRVRHRFSSMKVVISQAWSRLLRRPLPVGMVRRHENASEGLLEATTLFTLLYLTHGLLFKN